MHTSTEYNTGLSTSNTVNKNYYYAFFGLYSNLIITTINEEGLYLDKERKEVIVKSVPAHTCMLDERSPGRTTPQLNKNYAISRGIDNNSIIMFEK